MGEKHDRNYDNFALAFHRYAVWLHFLPDLSNQVDTQLRHMWFMLIYLASVHLDSLRDASHMDDLAQDKTFVEAYLQTKRSV